MLIFFEIFDEDDVLYILVEFESDPMSHRESARNGPIEIYSKGKFDFRAGISHDFLEVLNWLVEPLFTKIGNFEKIISGSVIPRNSKSF